MVKVILIVLILFIGYKLISPKKSSKNDTNNTPKSILWVNGTFGVLTKLNGWNPDIFGGFKPNLLSKMTTKSLLKNDWGIKSSEDLEETIHSLRNGMHNRSLLGIVMANHMDTTSREEFNEHMKGVKSKAQVAYFTNVYNAYERFGVNAIMGWDLSRAASLYSMGYIAGYCTYEEGTTKALDVGKQIQNTFDSWDSFYESYLYGYAFWSKADVSKKNTTYNTRVKLVESIKNDPNSFYHLDWNLDLTLEPNTVENN